MKDSVKEFEDLNNRIDNLFEGLGWLNPSNWFSDKPSGTQKIQYKLGQATSNRIAKIDSGECDFGTSNGRFSSEPGSEMAYFYDDGGSVTGTVKNIKPFLKKAGITKQTLRCYDLKKDKLKIGWIFDGKFNADILSWDTKKKKIIFQGKWNGGLYNGITYTDPVQTPAAEKGNYKYYVVKKGKQVGPYTANQIVAAINSGALNMDSIIRPENSADYQYIRDNKLLSILVKPTVAAVTGLTRKPIIKPVPIRVPKKRP